MNNLPSDVGRPLMKDGLGAQAIKRIANGMTQIIPQFDARKFQTMAAVGLDELELKARVHHLIGHLHSAHELPFKKLCQHLQKTICSRCGGAVSIIACIEDPSIINKILAHLDAKSGPSIA